MGCPLNGTYVHEHKVLGPCPCHLSQFDLAKGGSLVIGQATQRLPQILLRVYGGQIYALGVRGVIYGHADNLAGRAGVTRG